MEPAHEEVCANAAIEQHGGNRDVRDIRLEVGAARGGYLDRHLLHEEKDYGDIMRRKAPQRILLAANFSEVETIRVDILQPAQLALLDQLLKAGDRGMVLEQMSHHEDALE